MKREQQAAESGRAYSAPRVTALDVAVERGFAQSGGLYGEIPGEWGDDLNGFE